MSKLIAFAFVAFFMGYMAGQALAPRTLERSVEIRYKQPRVRLTIVPDGTVELKDVLIENIECDNAPIIGIGMATADFFDTQLRMDNVKIRPGDE